MQKPPKGISLDELAERNLILRFEEGAFKGRRMIIDKELAKEPVQWAMVEDGNMFGTPKFSPACLVHEIFIPSSGCLQCKEEEQSQAPEV